MQVHTPQSDVSDPLAQRTACVEKAVSLGYDTLADRLSHYAAEIGPLEAYRFLAPDGSDTRLSYRDLSARAGDLAAHLSNAGIRPGDPVALVIEPSLDFVIGFFACMCGGFAAVPLPRPRSEAARTRIKGVLDDTTCAAVLTTRTTAQALAPLVQGRLFLTTEAAKDADFQAATTAPDAVAVLQYTSGSTAAPKAAMITHGNLTAARDAINSAAALTAGDVVLSWLPTEHDMGLFGGMLQPFWMGAQSILMAPEHFTARPLRWLKAMTQHRVTVTVAPDSAYAICARLASSAADLDLSALAVAFSGAEPLRSETLDGFCAAFEPFGFRRTAFLPCYGLAEATLLVAGEGRARAPEILPVDAEKLRQGVAAPCSDATARKLVASGPPAPPNVCKIVDPTALSACAEGHIGEIWVTGPTIAAGYRGNPTATRTAFAGELPGDPRRYLRTGDLGFLHAGRLYVTGRQETRILRHGRSYDAADLERAVSGAHTALRAGKVAIAQSGQDEKIGALQEINPRKPEVFEAAARAIWGSILRQTGVAIDHVCLVRPGALLWTTSGKIRRTASQHKVDQDRDQILRRWVPPRSDLALVALIESMASGRVTARRIERDLCAWLAALSGDRTEDIDPDLPWSDQAVDSLKAAELVTALEQVQDRPLADDVMFTFPSPAALARHLAAVRT